MNTPTSIVGARNVLTFTFPSKPGDRFGMMHTSDWHWDSIYCQRDTLTKHLQYAVKNNLWIMVYGDMFDAMQGKFDPRRNMDELRPEFRNAAYFNIVVQAMAEYLEPYASNLLMISDGNHEWSIKDHNSYDLIQGLIDKLQSTGSLVRHGKYDGWIRIRLKRNDNSSLPYLIKYNHGYGGTDSPVTKGVIQTNRQAVYLPDANMVVNGHNHEAYVLPIIRERLKTDVPYQDTAYYLRTPGYKGEYIGSGESFVARKHPRPSPIGCIISEHTYARSHKPVETEMVETRAYPMIE